MSLWPDGAREMVTAAPVARLATADSAGRPHVVPICFALIEDRLYSIVDRKPKANPLRLKRLRNIAANPQVAVVVDRYDEDWTGLAYVLMRGEACVIRRGDEHDAVIAALREKYPQYRAMELVAGENPVIRVAVERVNMWRGQAPHGCTS